MGHDPGLLITFEGIEGSGKTTQAQRLYEYLRAKHGDRVIFTYEPGDTEVGRRIREILIDKRYVIDAWTELFLYLADRVAHVEQVIKPALDEGKIVISDRYADSSVAYQGAGGVPIDTIRKFNEVATFGIKPQLTVLLDLPVEEGLTRLGERDRIEAKDVEFHQTVRRYYLELARSEPDRFVVLDGSKPEDEIFETIVGIVDKLLVNRDAG